jgi:hypothetical protein
LRARFAPITASPTTAMSECSSTMRGYLLAKHLAFWP